MVDAALVADVWDDVVAIRELLSSYNPPPAVEALFVNDERDWRLVVVIRNLDETGSRPVYEALDEAASASGGPFWGLERVVLLGAGDAESSVLLRSQVDSSTPPRRLDLVLPALPGFSGAVIAKDTQYVRGRTGRELEAELADQLSAMGISTRETTRLEVGWRPDFIIDLGEDETVIVEAVVADRRSVKSRLRDAAGLANIANRPVILVLRVFGDQPLGLDPSYGSVPVLPIDWDVGGPDSLRHAIAVARTWYSDSPGVDGVAGS